MGQRCLATNPSLPFTTTHHLFPSAPFCHHSFPMRKVPQAHMTWCALHRHRGAPQQHLGPGQAWHGPAVQLYCKPQQPFTPETPRPFSRALLSLAGRNRTCLEGLSPHRYMRGEGGGQGRHFDFAAILEKGITLLGQGATIVLAAILLNIIPPCDWLLSIAWRWECKMNLAWDAK